MRISDWSSDVCSSDLDHVQVIAMLDVEQRVRKASQRPEAQLRNIQLTRVTRRTRRRVVFDVLRCMFQLIDKVGGDRHRLFQVKRQRRTNIRLRQGRADRGFHALRLRWVLRLLRRSAKYLASMRPTG